nr:ribonuclease H-like domain-containing protein [Tanacetum cinerariifolium]
MKYFNCQREGHMARQCLKPKRKTDATWFRDKVLLVEAQGSGKVLNEEELEFLADAKAVLMANLSSYRLNVLFEEVIENGNSWVSIPQTTQENGVSVTKMSMPVNAKEKINKKNDVKARSLLLMAFPNEDQLTFSQYNDAKTMFAAIETQFGVWMNKADIETMSIDDLYNNFKTVKQDVKKSFGASTGAQNMAFMIAPSTSSTNDVNTANPAYEASTVSPNVNTASPQVSIANFSGNDVYGFMVENPNATYKRGLETIEEQLVIYKKNEVLFSEEVAVLKREVACKDYEINVLKRSQITDNDKKGLGYHAVPPPYPLINNGPTKLELSYSGLDEFKEPEFKGQKGSMLSRPQHVRFGDLPDLMGKPQKDDKGYIDSGCSRHMTGNIAYLSDFKEFDGGYVTFWGGAHGGRISSKGTLKTASLDFENVYFVNELKFNLFSVSQICDKKNYVLFTDTECLVLSPNFKLPDES